MHQSFVTAAPPPPTGNSGDNDFSSITALLKDLHCGDLLSVIALHFIIVNSRVISQARPLPRTAGKLKRSLPHTLAPLSTAHPGEGGGACSGYKWLVHYHKYCIQKMQKEWQTVYTLIRLSWRSNLIWLYTVCTDLTVPKFRIITVYIGQTVFISERFPSCSRKFWFEPRHDKTNKMSVHF